MAESNSTELADFSTRDRGTGAQARAYRLGWLEMLLALSALSLVLQLLWPSLESWWYRPMAGCQVPARFDGESGSLEYLIYLPEGYGEFDQEWPLLLFLHGAGERGQDLEKVKLHGPPAVVDSGRSLPMIVVSPQCPAHCRWESQLLLELLDEVDQRFSVDSRRVFVSGFSMGGFGTWALATVAPDRFAAAIPVCGGGDTSKAGRLVKMSIWAFHGKQDKVVPLKASQEMVDAVRSAGGNARLTVYPDKGHGIWHLVYDDHGIYEWLAIR